MAGREVPITWDGRPARAWMPVPLRDRSLELPADVIRTVERAAASVQRAGDRIEAGWEPLARLLLRAEGMASSNIEGLRAPVAAVAAAQVGGGDPDDTAAWVADNLTVVDLALAAAQGRRKLRASDLHQWHTRLMAHGGLEGGLVGHFRDRQGWIGGRSPRDAAFVPPPPEFVPELIDDLLAFANRTDIDAVTQAAMLHGQFETIHPYGDGNGRIGRLLIGWTLARRLDVTVPPPLSVLIARDTGGYLAGLHWFRSGDTARWIEWFARIVDASGKAAIEWTHEVADAIDGWHTAVEDLRADAAARRLLGGLPAHPVVSVRLVAQLLGVTETAARSAVTALTERGVLSPYEAAASQRGRPRHLWVAPALVDLVRGWAR